MTMTTMTGWIRLSPQPRRRLRSKRLRWSRTHSNNYGSRGGGIQVKSSKSKKHSKASVVPVLKTPPELSAHFPLPSSVEDPTIPQQENFQQQRDQLLEMQQQQENGKKLQRMRTVRARDGGRMQSNVKGVLTAEDGGENF